MLDPNRKQFCSNYGNHHNTATQNFKKHLKNCPVVVRVYVCNEHTAC